MGTDTSASDLRKHLFAAAFSTHLEDILFNDARRQLSRQIGLIYALPGYPSRLISEAFNRVVSSNDSSYRFPDYRSDFGRVVFVHHDSFQSGDLSLSTILDIRTAGNHLVYVTSNGQDVPAIIRDNLEGTLAPSFDAFSLAVASFRSFVAEAGSMELSDLKDGKLRFVGHDGTEVKGLDDIFVRCEGLVAPQGKWKRIEKSEQFATELFFMFRDFALRGSISSREVARCDFWTKPKPLSATVAPDVDSVSSLDEFPGISGIRNRLSDLLRRYGSPNPPKSGLLLYGPSGTGKTMLARTIARASDRNLVATSVGAWQSGTHLGTLLGNMSDDFRRAREMAPSMIFIDELDSLPNRAKSGKVDFYDNSVVNLFLELVDGFSDRGNVLLVGATNHKDRIDPAVLRPGRFGEHVQVPYPSVEGICEIVRWALEHAECDNGISLDVDPQLIARKMIGTSPAQIRSMIDAAVDACNASGQPLDLRHFDQAFREASFNLGYGGSATPTSGAVRRVSVHEAGHALCAHLFMAGSVEELVLLDGVMTQGMVTTTADWRAAEGVGGDLMRGIVRMAGRAAEYIVLGMSGMGYGATADLAEAREIGNYLARGGLSPNGFADLVDTENEAARSAAAAEWVKWFNSAAMTALTQYRDQLDALACEVAARKTLKGDEVHRLLASLGVPSGLPLSDLQDA